MDTARAKKPWSLSAETPNAVSNVHDGQSGRPDKGILSSIVDVGSVLLALTPAGEFVTFQPAGAAYTELARYKVADGGTYAYPIPAGHGIYVKDQDSLTLWTVD